VLGATALVAACVWTSDLLATALKLAADRPRPFESVPEADPLLGGVGGSSFPSGHAATSAAGALALSLLAPRLAPLLAALALGIAFSRVYVGVHYPLDVVGGAALGLAVTAVLVRAFRPLLRTSEARRRSGAPRQPG
jgi:undecaprenyl-diphosphatase